MPRILRRFLVAVAVLALLAALSAPWVAPLSPAPDTLAPMRLAGADAKYAISDGVRLRYVTAGDGEPALVYLHGFGSSVETWRTSISRQRTGSRVVAFDRPGFGLSVRPMPPYETGNPYTTAAAAEQTLALLDYLGVGKCVLVAHSAAAEVAVELALTHAQRVEGLLLEAPAVYESERPEFVRGLMRSPWGRHYGPLVLRRTFPGSARKALERAYADPSALTPQRLAEYEVALKAADWDRALWELAAAPGAFDQEDLTRLTVPVTVVFGSEDEIVEPEESRRAAAAIEGAEVVEVPGVGHIPHEEAPEAFDRAIEDLLNRVAAVD